MTYNGYEVLPDYLDEDTILWKCTGNGEYIIAKKGGEKYFIKRNMHVRYPADDLPKEVKKDYLAAFNALKAKQEDLKDRLKGLSWDKDHIVVEEDHFKDHENRFVTITHCISDALAATYDYTKLGRLEFIALCKMTAEALAKLHEKGVIHGDLKGKNIIVVHKAAQFIPYLIDFDSSYPVDKIPEWEDIGGSEGYQSPEVMLYGLDEGSADKSTITPATDIFSLAVVMHKWWTGVFPAVDLERGSVGAAVYLDAAVTIDKKFEALIGNKHKETLVSLINWMFAKDPHARPTAQQVAEVLDDKAEIPLEYHKGDDTLLFDKELWSAHKRIAELLPTETLKTMGVKSFKRINEGSGSAWLKYCVATNDDKERKLTIDELLKCGYAKIIPACIEKPWEDDQIEFLSENEIAEKGFSEIRRGVKSGKYRITTASGVAFDKGKDWLIIRGVAKEKIVDVEADTPWPEHGSTYDVQLMARYKILSISRLEIAGEHRYKYVKIIDGVEKTFKGIPGRNLILMGYIK